MVIEYCGHTYLHEKIYEECKKYTKWSASHEASKFSDELDLQHYLVLLWTGGSI